jgi:hypothetical protein
MIGKFETTSPTRQVRFRSRSPTTRIIRNGLISPATRSRRGHSDSREWSSRGGRLCASGMGPRRLASSIWARRSARSIRLKRAPARCRGWCNPVTRPSR